MINRSQFAILESNKPITSVALLITHFNRVKSLERLLLKLKETGLTFKQLIVSDGGSRPEILDEVQKLKLQYNFTLITTPVNIGLGHTINVGVDAANTPYILYIQEDFFPKHAFVEVLNNALQIMDEEEEWDIIRFYSFPWAKFPYLNSYKKGFSEMLFRLRPWYINHHKFYVYSDHPHLRRKSFSDKFGRHLEILDADKTELSMCRSFLKQKGRGLYYEDYTELFEHKNSQEEPGQERPHKQKMKKYAEIKALYWFYLKYKTFKETVDYIFDI